MTIAGRRTFIVASVFLALTGVLHAVGQLTYRETDPVRLAIERSQHEARMPLGLGMAPTLFDLEMVLGWSFAICMVWLGAVGIVVVTGDLSPRTLRRLTFVQLAGCAALVLLYVRFKVPPPFVSMALVEVMFVLSLLRQAMGFGK